MPAASLYQLSNIDVKISAVKEPSTPCWTHALPLRRKMTLYRHCTSSKIPLTWLQANCCNQAFGKLTVFYALRIRPIPSLSR